MKITAIRQIQGDYGTLLPGESKDIPDDTAKSLLLRGLVKPYSEIKAIVPDEQPAPKIQAQQKQIANKDK